MRSFLKAVAVGALTYGVLSMLAFNTRMGRPLRRLMQHPDMYFPMVDSANLVVTIFTEKGPVHAVQLEATEPMTSDETIARAYESAAAATRELPDLTDLSEIDKMIEEYFSA